MLLNFLRARGLDLRSATESDIREFRLWRREEADETVGEATWDRDSAAIGGLYNFLVDAGYVEARPWRATRRTASLRSGTSRDLRVRHTELEQYLYCRDVGFGDLGPDARLDETFQGWRPHRNRAACELALMTGMRVQEWATVLMPELGLETGLRPQSTDLSLSACAQYSRPRSVYVPVAAMELLDPYCTSSVRRSSRRRSIRCGVATGTCSSFSASRQTARGSVVVSMAARSLV